MLNSFYFYLFILTLQAIHITFVVSYKPVFLMHGVLSGNRTMVKLAQKIQKIHPGTKVYVSSNFCHWSSLDSLLNQVVVVGAQLMEVSALHPEGFHLLGYSQGGLLARSILQYFSFHRVKTFISLSSPQAGQYGNAFLHLLFKYMIKERAYEVFYSRIGQHISIANYWNDPHQQVLYYEYSTFLPYFNNEIMSPLSASFKYGIVKLDRMVLIGGPDDGVISPWQSSHFSCYDENETVINLEDMFIYKNDLFGLRTLNESNRLHIISVPGVQHHYWHKNKTVIERYIIPWLN